MRFKTYPKYKPSNIEWLDDFPEHWTVAPLGRISSDAGSVFIDGDWIESKDISAEGIRYLTSGNIGEGYFKEQGQGFISDTTFAELNCTEVLAGDVLISRLNLPIGRACIAPKLESRIVTCVDNVIVRPNREFDSKFIVYMLSSKGHFANMENLARGTTMQRVSRSKLSHVRFPFPPQNEQSAIATFLDRETAKIDTLIAKQEKLIELLKEKRQSVISHAVTKGLNPNVKMKDSGIRWLGEVPEHWMVKAIKHIVSTPVTDGPHETPDFPDEGIPFVSAEAVSSGTIDFAKIRGYISKEDNLRYSEKYQPQRGDIYMVKSGATTGITAIVETDIEFNIWSPLAVIRCGEEASPRFVLNFMRSKNFLEAVTLNWSFGTQQNIGMGVIENLAVTVPPVEEQQVIASFLDRQNNIINRLIAKAQQAIVLQKEHRTALISAAVTGKIDVREAA